MSSNKPNPSSVAGKTTAPKKTGAKGTKKQNAATKPTDSKSGKSGAPSSKPMTEENINDAYKAKCRKIERRMKELVFLNTALDSELIDYKNKIAEASDERKFLLGQLLGHQKEAHGADATSKILQQALSKKAKNEKTTRDSNGQFSSPSGPASKKRKVGDASTSSASTSPGHRFGKSLDMAPKLLSQLLIDCNSGASSSSFLTDHPASA
jgi:hypothetical protein